MQQRRMEVARRRIERAGSPSLYKLSLAMKRIELTQNGPQILIPAMKDGERKETTSTYGMNTQQRCETGGDDPGSKDERYASISARDRLPSARSRLNNGSDAAAKRVASREECKAYNDTVTAYTGRDFGV